MSTSYEDTRHAGSVGDARAIPPDYLAYKDEPINEYMVRLTKGPAVDHPENQKNLFDDSPIEDKRWTQMARRFLKHSKHRQ